MHVVFPLCYIMLMQSSWVFAPRSKIEAMFNVLIIQGNYMGSNEIDKSTVNPQN